jgi:cytochrome P450
MDSDMGLGVRRPACFPFFGEGIFTQDGPAWKHSRQMLQRQFSRVQARDLETFTDQVEALISTFRDSKGVVDLQPAFFRFTLATTTALLFGESIEVLSQAEQTEFEHHFDSATWVTAVRLPLAHLSFLFNTPSYRKSCKIVRRYADRFIEKAFQYARDRGQEKATEKYPFIFDLHTEYQDRSLVRDQLVNVLLAGRDTTACTMSWTIFHLVRHPEMLQRLREEIIEVTGSETVITRSHTKNMTYLNAVLNESEFSSLCLQCDLLGAKLTIAASCSPQTLYTSTHEHQINSENDATSKRRRPRRRISSTRPKERRHHVQPLSYAPSQGAIR